MILKRIYELLNLVPLYNAYKFVFIYNPVLGQLLRDLQNLKKTDSNIKSIGGNEIKQLIRARKPENIYAYGLRLEKISLETVFRESILNIPLITNDNIIMSPIYTMQNIDAKEHRVLTDDTYIGMKNFEQYMTIETSGTIEITYLDLMTIPILRLHALWLTLIQNILNNEFAVFSNDKEIINPPFANIYVALYTPDIRDMLIMYEYIYCYPINDPTFRAISGAINEVDLTEVQIAYNYRTTRRYIISDIGVKNMDIRRKSQTVYQLLSNMQKIIAKPNNQYPEKIERDIINAMKKKSVILKTNTNSSINNTNNINEFDLLNKPNFLGKAFGNTSNIFNNIFNNSNNNTTVRSKNVFSKNRSTYKKIKQQKRNQ